MQVQKKQGLKQIVITIERRPVHVDTGNLQRAEISALFFSPKKHQESS